MKLNIKKSTLLKGGMFLVAHATAYQTGLRYGTFNQLELANQNNFLNNVLVNTHQFGNSTKNAQDLYITWLYQEGGEHVKTINRFESTQNDLSRCGQLLQKISKDYFNTLRRSGETQNQTEQSLKNKGKALEQTQTYLNQEGDAHFETLKDLDQERTARNQTRQALGTTQANLLKTQGESSSLRNELAEVRETLDHTHEEYFEALEDQQHQSDQDILDVANAYQGELAKEKATHRDAQSILQYKANLDKDNLQRQLDRSQEGIEGLRSYLGTYAKEHEQTEQALDQAYNTGNQTEQSLKNKGKALEQTQTYLNQEGDAHFETLKDLDQERTARNQTRQALGTTQANLLKTQGESSSLRNELAEVRETLDHTHEEYFEALEDQQHQSDQDILDVANAYQGELAKEKATHRDAQSILQYKANLDKDNLQRQLDRSQEGIEGLRSYLGAYAKEHEQTE